MRADSSRGDRAVTAAVAHIDRFVADTMRATAMPGLALAITSRDRQLASRAYGFANLEAGIPVTDETLFQFGSIGKSFTAICFLQLAEEGRVDLQAPVTAYLPWFSVRSVHEPITIHHLLTHTSGLSGGSDFSPDQRYEVWALRETEAAPPGARARYSNVGYKVLGLVLEAVTGQPYGQLVAERIYAPLGMTCSAAAITNDLRPRLAVGYVDFYNDRPWRPEHGFAPAAWLETNSADGCLAAPAVDLALFLRMLLNGGVGPHGRILSESSFSLLTAPHTELGESQPYGYGLMVGAKDGRQRIGHGGGMVGFVSSMTGDVDAGIGVVALTNAMQDTSDIAEFALLSMVRALAGDSLPDPPAPPAIDLGSYTGAYRDGAALLTVEEQAGTLYLLRAGERIALDPLGVPPIPDQFLARRADLALFPFRFLRDDAGRVEGLVHGPYWYPAAWYDGPTEFETPAAWRAYPGHYRSYNPWTPGFRVVLRQGALRLIYPWGEESLLRPDGDGFRVDDEPEGPERFVFDTIVDGQALRAGSPGSETYYRFFTP
jgi:D-alanyl-D-alanine carboxypeptidase